MCTRIQARHLTAVFLLMMHTDTLTRVQAEPVIPVEWTSVGVTLLRNGSPGSVGRLHYVPFTAGGVWNVSYSAGPSETHTTHTGTRVKTQHKPMIERDGLAFTIGDYAYRPPGRIGSRIPNVIWPADIGQVIDLETSPPLDQISTYHSPSRCAVVLLTPTPAPSPQSRVPATQQLAHENWNSTEISSLRERVAPLRDKFPDVTFSAEFAANGDPQIVIRYGPTIAPPGGRPSPTKQRPKLLDVSKAINDAIFPHYYAGGSVSQAYGQTTLSVIRAGPNFRRLPSGGAIQF